MTRFLSEALEAKEPWFNHHLRQIEEKNFHPSIDIRLTNDIIKDCQSKMKELGLDPNDTSSQELFLMLKHKIKGDDKKLTRQLQTLAASQVSAEGDAFSGIKHVLDNLPYIHNVFSLKTSRLKSMLKSNPPKKAMKSLGYRSIDSMLKHEPSSLVLFTSLLYESSSWQKRLSEQYKKLLPSDFEEKKLTILYPKDSLWKTISEDYIKRTKNIIVSFKELGTIIILPTPVNQSLPAGFITLTLCLALEEVNQIMSASSYLKFNRHIKSFNQIVVKVINSDSLSDAKLLDVTLPWHLINRYFNSKSGQKTVALFDPYLKFDDIVYHPIEEILTDLEPSFKFWLNTSFLGFLDKNKTVSLNVIDNAINYVNQYDFSHLVNHYFKSDLWYELYYRYINHQPIEDQVIRQLQPNREEILKI